MNTLDALFLANSRIAELRGTAANERLAAEANPGRPFRRLLPRFLVGAGRIGRPTSRRRILDVELG